MLLKRHSLIISVSVIFRIVIKLFKKKFESPSLRNYANSELPRKIYKVIFINSAAYKCHLCRLMILLIP
jgi:hypothetical protein